MCENWHSHTVPALIEESCESRMPTDARNRLIFSPRWRGEKNVFQPASALPCWEQGNLSLEVEYSRERENERETERGRKKGKWARHWAWFGNHFITHCAWLSHCSGSAMPAARRKVSCWVLSIGCHSEKIWGNIKCSNLHNTVFISAGDNFS